MQSVIHVTTAMILATTLSSILFAGFLIFKTIVELLL